MDWNNFFFPVDMFFQHFLVTDGTTCYKDEELTERPIVRVINMPKPWHSVS